MVDEASAPVTRDGAPGTPAGSGFLELADWRRRFAAMFETWRQTSETDAEVATNRFRAEKDRLFRDHAQSPLRPDARAAFVRLPYWPYDPAYRMTARFEADPAAERLSTPDGEAPDETLLRLPTSGAEPMAFRRIGRAFLTGPLAGRSLGVYWIEGYGGGLFLPFRDATSGSETYGAGRYLLDSIKSADHGADAAAGTLTLDFNMAYHPSCVYDPRWACPLPPPENGIDLPVRVGERLAD